MSEPERTMAPVQGYAPGIPWSLHMEAYSEYAKRHGKQEALITGRCRGGFATSELDMFVPGWRDKVSEITKLRDQIHELTAQRDACLAACKASKAYEQWDVVEIDFAQYEKILSGLGWVYGADGTEGHWDFVDRIRREAIALCTPTPEPPNA